jgi:Flp pilus assembly pilin Flp
VEGDLMRDDDGVSMIEVTVSLTLMAVLMTIFTTAVLSVYRSVNRTEAISNAQSQLNIAFLRLDKDVRYASGISDSKEIGGYHYVEYLNTSLGTEVCTELRFGPTSGLLQRRTWNRNQTPLAPTPWAILASNLSLETDPLTGAPYKPFELIAADPTGTGNPASNFQKLQIRLAVWAQGKQVATSTIAFYALNTSLASTSSGICTEGRAVA